MHIGIPSLFLVMMVGQPGRDCYQTANFIVYADTAETAKKVGDAAEIYRKDLAKLWLPKGLADWSVPCRIEVAGGELVRGVADISYSNGKVLFHEVRISGPLECVLRGPLPHELTHVLLAHHFGRRVPRWADEGVAILSEGEAQKAKHRRAFGDILLEQRQFPLREFLGLEQYPADIPCLYAQGHSVAGFLVAAKGREIFLAFLRAGINGNWDEAAREQYGYPSVEHLERAWLGSLSKQAKASP